MFPAVAKFIVGLVVVAFLALCFWEKPTTRDGETALKLSLLNAVGWLIMLAMPQSGFPGPIAPLAFVLFWLVNCILVPAIAVVLWICRRDGQEGGVFLSIVAGYLTLNVIVLFIIPLVALVTGYFRNWD